jgi:hypothetical protein
MASVQVSGTDAQRMHSPRAAPPWSAAPAARILADVSDDTMTPDRGRPALVGSFAQAVATCADISTPPLLLVERHYRERAGQLSPQQRTMWSACRQVLGERGVDVPDADDRGAR